MGKIEIQLDEQTLAHALKLAVSRWEGEILSSRDSW